VGIKLNPFDGNLTIVGNSGGGGGGGITSLNGLSDSSQTFSIGTSGTTIAVVSASGIHTFNIPNASTSGVTRGVISNTEYQNLLADKYKVEKFTLNGTDITNEYVTLAATPTDAADTRLIVIGGLEQEYSIDFTVSGNQVTWNGLGLDGFLEVGDDLIIVYN